MNADSLARKIIACLIAGLTVGALLLQVGRDYRPGWMSPPMVFAASGISVLAALLYAVYWHFRKKDNDFIFPVVLTVLSYALAFGIALFGWKKVFKLQFQVPLSMLDQPVHELSGEWLTWAYFGYSYPFGLVVALAQLSGAALLLFPKTRLLGVFILLPVLVNILFINIFYHLNVGALLQSVFLTLGLFYLLSLHYRELAVLFFGQSAIKMNIVKRLSLLSAIVLPLWLVFPSRDAPKDELNGVYEAINATHSASQSIGLTKVFFEAGQVMVLEYGSYKNREVIAYSYDRNTRLLKAVFVKNNLPETLSVVIKTVKNQLTMSGTMNEKPFSVELKKI